MKTLIISTFSLSLFLFSCGDSDEDQPEEMGSVIEFTKKVKDKNSKAEVRKAIYQIGDSLQETNLSRFKYFGTFFKGRAHYFHNFIDSVNNGSHTGYDLLLAYFDNQLARVKYKLEKDISVELIHKYGSCKIRPLDSLATVIVKSKKILIKNNDQVALNEDLKNYQMTWLKEGREIVLTSKARFGSSPLFIYEERIPDYKDALIYLTRY